MTRDWHFQHDAGRPFAETSAELTARFPEQAERIAAYGPRWLETIPAPMPGMIELVDELAADGVQLYAVTNFSAEFWPRFVATAPVFTQFRDIVVSGVERLTKPGPEIYALAMARFGLAPGEAVFIDDRPENVVAGNAAGLVGHVFDGAVGTRMFLAAQGLLAAPARAA